MAPDEAGYVGSCHEGQRNKKRIGHRNPMVNPPTPQQAFDITSIDTIRPSPRTKNGNMCTVTIQCEPTKIIFVISVPSSHEITVFAKAMMENFILGYERTK